MSSSTLISLNNIEKRFGEQSLFTKLSLSIEARDQVGIVGPNGAGKSTLLKIIANSEVIDGGSVLRRQFLRTSYVGQSTDLKGDISILDLALASAKKVGIPDSECRRLAYTSLASMKLNDNSLKVSQLSGGQIKRLQIALGLSEDPELLLLDEPTNHLDIEGIIELEAFLKKASFAWVVVSHDRWFLENAVSKIVEVNRALPLGILKCDGAYGEYLLRKENLIAAESKRKDSLENKVRTEQAWLRQGAKARTTKSKKRIADAFEMMESLSLLRGMQQVRKVGIEFSGSERKTKKLIELCNISKSFAEHVILQKIDLKLITGQALGVLGRNGSGKSTFVKLLAGEIHPDTGTIKRADNLSVSYFQQFENSMSSKINLKEFLCPEGDSVVYKGKETHITGWAKRFQFGFEQLQQPFNSLSGGEKARARIARLMLESPDVLILDEPTNDLDIGTLELLEDSLIDFEGALVLVTHDRFLINRVCNSFLGLDGVGQAKVYADYAQWEREILSIPKIKAENRDSQNIKEKVRGKSRRLSYNEQREYDSIEEAIMAAESELRLLQKELEVTTSADKLQQLCLELDQTQRKIQNLYTRWVELEEKVKDLS